jgi:hypothetical protein
MTSAGAVQRVQVPSSQSPPSADKVHVEPGSNPIPVAVAISIA